MPQALPIGPLVVYLGDEAPSSSDDSQTIRARRGYWWVDRSASEFWVCVDPAEGAAIWRRLADAENLSALAYSGSWKDLSDTPTTLTGYGIEDAATASGLSAHVQDESNPHAVTAAQVGAAPVERAISAGAGLEGGGDLSEDRAFGLTAAVVESLGRADSAVQPGVLGSAAFVAVSAFDPAGSASAVAGDLDNHQQATGTEVHGLGTAALAAFEDFDPAGSAFAAQSNAATYTDEQIGGLGSAAHEHVGTWPMELPRNTELGSGAFAPYEPNSLYPIIPSAAHALTPDDSGKVVWSDGYDITLPETDAPGMEHWRAWVKNTHPSASLTIGCHGAATIHGAATLTLSAGEARLLVLIAAGLYGSLN